MSEKERAMMTISRPEIVTEDHLDFLDDQIRGIESSLRQMFGLDEAEARVIIKHWMELFLKK